MHNEDGDIESSPWKITDSEKEFFSQLDKKKYKTNTNSTTTNSIEDNAFLIDQSPNSEYESKSRTRSGRNKRNGKSKGNTDLGNIKGNDSLHESKRLMFEEMFQKHQSLKSDEFQQSLIEKEVELESAHPSKKLKLTNTTHTSSKLLGSEFYEHLGGDINKATFDEISPSKIPSKNVTFSYQEKKKTSKLDKKMMIERESVYNRLMALNQNIRGVVFCDCECMCETRFHELESCYYKTVDSILEYCNFGYDSQSKYENQKDGVHIPDSIFQTDILQPIVEDLMEIYKIISFNTISYNKIAIQKLFELFDCTDCIIPVSISMFFRVLDNGDNNNSKKNRTEDKDTIKKSTKAINSNANTKCFSQNLKAELIHEVSKITNSTKQKVDGHVKKPSDINQRICFHESRRFVNEETQSANMVTEGETKYIVVCCIVDSHITSCEHIIRSCLTYECKATKDHTSSTISSSSNSQTNRDSNLEIKEGGTLILSKEDLAFVQSIQKFNKDPSYGVTSSHIVGTIWDTPTFHNISKLNKPSNITPQRDLLWSKLKSLEIWTYVRSFIVESPSKIV